MGHYFEVAHRALRMGKFDTIGPSHAEPVVLYRHHYHYGALPVLSRARSAACGTVFTQSADLDDRQAILARGRLHRLGVYRFWYQPLSQWDSHDFTPSEALRRSA